MKKAAPALAGAALAESLGGYRWCATRRSPGGQGLVENTTARVGFGLGMFTTSVRVPSPAML